MSSHQHEELAEIRRAVAGLCEGFPGEYWRAKDGAREYPAEFVDALTKAGFQLPPEQYPSNLLGTHYYDQIAFRTRKDELTFLSSGAFDWNQTLFRPDHYEHYAPAQSDQSSR